MSPDGRARDAPAGGAALAAYPLLVAATLFWGGNAVAGKLAAGSWPPMLLTFARWAIATLVLLPFAWPMLRRDAVLLRRHAALLLGLGAVGMGVFNLGIYTALNHTSAINVSIEQAFIPVFIMLLNFAVLSQRVGPLQIVGLVCSALGVAITATHGEPLRIADGGLNRGDGMMLGAGFAYALYTFGLRWRPPIHWLSFLVAIATGGALLSLPLAVFETVSRPWPVLEARDLAILGYIVLFPTMVSQLAYARGVSLIGGNRAGLFVNLVPVFGSLLAIGIVGEHLQTFHVIGFALVFAGILVAERGAGADGGTGRATDRSPEEDPGR